MNVADLPCLDARGLCALLERSQRQLPGSALLASDADGTLWSGDLGEEVFDAAVSRGLLRNEARDALSREARDLDLDASGDANVLAHRLREAHLQGLYERERAFGMMAWAFAGFTIDELSALGRSVLNLESFGSRLRPELVEVRRWAAERQVPFWVVSASPQPLVELCAGLLQVPPSQVLAMRPAESQGRLLPWLAGPSVYAEGKVRVLRASAGNTPVLAAFGDSAWDLALLRAAAIPVAVHPSAELVALASELPGLVRLEGGAAR